MQIWRVVNMILKRKSWFICQWSSLWHVENQQFSFPNKTVSLHCEWEKKQVFDSLNKSVFSFIGCKLDLSVLCSPISWQYALAHLNGSVPTCSLKIGGLVYTRLSQSVVVIDRPSFLLIGVAALSKFQRGPCHLGKVSSTHIQGVQGTVFNYFLWSIIMVVK